MPSSSHAAHFPLADESVQPPAVFFFFFSEETVKELLLIAPMLCFTRPVMSLRAEHNRTRLHRLLCRARAKRGCAGHGEGMQFARSIGKGNCCCWGAFVERRRWGQLYAGALQEPFVLESGSGVIQDLS